VSERSKAEFFLDQARQKVPRALGLIAFMAPESSSAQSAAALRRGYPRTGILLYLTGISILTAKPAEQWRGDGSVVAQQLSHLMQVMPQVRHN